MCPREESNLHGRLRTAEFYPLNYEDDLKKPFLHCIIPIQKIKDMGL